ncbi:MAG TPA: hypothetical protein VIL32_16390 [Steroidobacteraceae bacterium]
MEQPSVIGPEKTDNLLMGVVGGAMAAVTGALVWAVVTVLTGYQIGWLAVGVGFLVGITIRYSGRGSTMVYRLLGAVFALLGCVAGNFFSVVAFAASEQGISFFELLPQVDVMRVVGFVIEDSGPIDLLFYGLAVYEGFKLSTVPAAAESENTTSGS